MSLRLGSHSEPNLLEDTCHSMETLWLRSRVHIILSGVLPTQTFWMTIIFTMSPLLMLSASKNTTKLRSSMWSVYDKSLKISSWSWVLRPLLDVRIRIYQMFSKGHHWISFDNQSSRRQWLGLPLVSLPHQRVILKVDILLIFDVSDI